MRVHWRWMQGASRTRVLGSTLCPLSVHSVSILCPFHVQSTFTQCPLSVPRWTLTTSLPRTTLPPVASPGWAPPG